MATTRVPLKDQLFNRRTVATLADRIGSAGPSFGQRTFVDEVVGRLGVWPYFTDPARYALWMGTEVTLSPIPGGIY